MTLTAVILLAISAITHAAWNLVSKREQPTAAFFLVTNTAATLCLLPAAILFWRMLAEFTPQVWLLLLVTGFFQAVYYAALGRAYCSGDMSVAYPLARSLPVVYVAAVTCLLGHGRELSVLSLSGMALVALGVILLPARHFRDFSAKNYLTPMCLLAVVAAVGTAGYSMVDDAALRCLRSATNGIIRPTLVFAFLEGISASVWLAAYVLARPGRMGAARGVIARQLKPAVLAGVGICIAYTLVLISMAFVRNISYVVAFRQMSILIGVLLGISVLGEKPWPPKIAGVSCAFAGLVLVKLG